MLAQGKVDHRGYGKTSFGRQSHVKSPSGNYARETPQDQYLSVSINYMVSRAF
jgi:hypothetical protein